MKWNPWAAREAEDRADEAARALTKEQSTKLKGQAQKVRDEADQLLALIEGMARETKGAAN